MFTRRNLIRTGIASAAIIRFPGVTNISFAETAGIPSITFTVDDVIPGTKALPTHPVKEAIKGILSAPNSPLESWSRDTAELLVAPPDLQPFLSAVTAAYHNHYPIIFSPDMIWLQILQGLASHVNANADDLRHHFVSHEGKKLIEIRRDRFVKGNPNNDWEGAFAEFSTKMRGHIGAETHDLIASSYSTTGPAEQAAMNVALMDAMQSYFTYGMTSSCGFPSVTLEGSEDDWRTLRTRAAKLAQFDLDWWMKALLPVLDQFIETSAGRPDKDFWCNFYKLQSVGSGTPHIHGHINTLYPYLGKKRPTKERLVSDFEVYIRNTKYMGRMSESAIVEHIKKFASRLKDGNGSLKDTLRRNPFIGRTDLKLREGMTTKDVSTKMNSAPMVWNYHGKMLQMELLAGFIGSTQNSKTLAIRPKVGWAVRNGIG